MPRGQSRTGRPIAEGALRKMMLNKDFALPEDESPFGTRAGGLKRSTLGNAFLSASPAGTSNADIESILAAPQPAAPLPPPPAEVPAPALQSGEEHWWGNTALEDLLPGEWHDGMEIPPGARVATNPDTGEKYLVTR